MPCAAGELCLVPALAPERFDGHKCLGKCGGRLHGLCGGANADCDNEVNVDETEDRDGDTTVRGGGAPPPYVELSSHFVSLESAAEACGKGDASF